MIDDTLIFLRDSLNSYLLGGAEPDDAAGEPPVRFATNDPSGTVKFATDALTLLLINLEQENVLRAPDPYVRILADGTQQRINPDVRLNLYVLCVAQFNNYTNGLRSLSRVIEYFQRNRVFTPQSAPRLSEKIDQLVVELVTLPFGEQNEIWGALRTAYQLSALYKVKMVVFRDADTLAEPGVQTVDNRIQEKT